MRDLLNRVRALRQKKTALVTENERTLASAAAAGRALTDEERAADDRIAGEIAAKSDELGRYERLLEADRTAAAVTEDDRAAIAQFNGDPKCGFRNLAEFALAVRGHYGQGGRVDERIGRLLSIGGAAPTSPAKPPTSSSPTTTSPRSSAPSRKADASTTTFASSSSSSCVPMLAKS